MLIIRKEQMEALREPFRRNFEHMLFLDLAPLHPQRPDAWIRQEITEGVHQALSFGIEIGADVHRFVSLRLNFSEIHEKLLAQPRIQRVMKDPNKTAASKINFLEQESFNPTRAE